MLLQIWLTFYSIDFEKTSSKFGPTTSLVASALIVEPNAHDVFFNRVNSKTNDSYTTGVRTTKRREYPYLFLFPFRL